METAKRDTLDDIIFRLEGLSCMLFCLSIASNDIAIKGEVFGLLEHNIQEIKQDIEALIKHNHPIYSLYRL